MTAQLPADTQPILRAGRYALDELIGRGGLGVTHRAHDRRLGRWVAVKSLVPDPSGGPEGVAAQRARFVREARVLARFDHPGIVRVYEVFEEEGSAHLVMEYLHGRSVAGEVAARSGPLPSGEVLALAAGVGRALAVVHAAGLLHRDVSPSNVMLVATDDGRGRRPVLIDFGLARDAGDVTATYTRMVTPGFAPPEQYGGDPGRIGPATDVYGLAATLYHAATGRLPASAVDRQQGARLEPLRRLRPDLPRVFADGVHDGLELEAAHRPATVDAFLARLGLAAPPFFGGPATPSVAEPPKNGEVVGPVASRRWPALVPPVLLAAAAGVAAPLVAVAVLAAVVLPGLATTGDLLRGRRRLAVPWRLARNVGASLVASFPALLVAFVGAGLSLLVDRASLETQLDDVVAAVAGSAAAVLVVARVGADRAAFAVADVVDAWARRARDGLLYGAWAVSLLAAMGALALRPDLWPLASP